MEAAAFTQHGVSHQVRRASASAFDARWDALRDTLERLTGEVAGALEDGTWAVPEAARLHAWVKSELVPLSVSMEAAIPKVDVAARAGVASDRGLLLGLNSLLSGSRGQEAGQWSREIGNVGRGLIDRLEDLTA
jgi:hypothetical protein